MCGSDVTLILPKKLIYYCKVFNLNSQINGRAMTQTTYSQNNVKVVVSDNTVRINNPYSLQLTLSSTNQLAVSVSDEVADTVYGACGKLMPNDTTLRALRERLLVSISSTIFASLNIGQWTAPDFPQW